MIRACVIIPTYNEARTIAGLIDSVRSQGLEIIVVDDGSCDGTFEVCRRSRAICLRNESNQGKGASLIRGFEYARKHDFDAVITMDGDGQHDPQDIPYFLRLAEHSNDSIIIGNRMRDLKAMPRLRRMTNKLMSWFISAVARQNIPDTQCGFRLIKKEVLDKIRLETSKYETESEVLIEASRLGFKIESVPIRTIYCGEKSQINPFFDTLRFIKFIFKKLWTTPS